MIHHLLSSSPKLPQAPLISELLTGLGGPAMTAMWWPCPTPMSCRDFHISNTMFGVDSRGNAPRCAGLGEKIDVLMNNAGVMAIPQRQETKDEMV